MTKTFQSETLFGFSNFGHWKLFDICNFNNSMKCKQSKSPLGISNAFFSGQYFYFSEVDAKKSSMARHNGETFLLLSRIR
jgi:hypothetical protein